MMSERTWSRLLTLSLPSLLPHLPLLETMGMPRAPSSSDLPYLPATTGTQLVYGTTLRTCAVCMQDYVPGEQLRVLEPCTHVFHQHCLQNYFEKGGRTCPVCKRGVARPRFDATVRNGGKRGKGQSKDCGGCHVRWENVGLIDEVQGWIPWITGILSAYAVGRDVG